MATYKKDLSLEGLLSREENKHQNNNRGGRFGDPSVRKQRPTLHKGSRTHVRGRSTTTNRSSNPSPGDIGRRTVDDCHDKNGVKPVGVPEAKPPIACQMQNEAGEIEKLQADLLAIKKQLADQHGVVRREEGFVEIDNGPVFFRGMSWKGILCELGALWIEAGISALAQQTVYFFSRR